MISFSECQHLEKVAKHRSDIKTSKSDQGGDGAKHSKERGRLHGSQRHAIARFLWEALFGEAEMNEVCEGAVGK